ncbi:MAG: hypothetical protein RIC85_00940 [Gammaproteobacteria bacterium]
MAPTWPGWERIFSGHRQGSAGKPTGMNLAINWLKASTCSGTVVGGRTSIERPCHGQWLSSAEPPNKALNPTLDRGLPSLPLRSPAVKRGLAQR